MNEKQIYNIYIDESCHLENDGMPIMAFGAIWCPKSESKRLSQELRDIKKRHNAKGELKWSKVSKSRLDFYIEVVDWFIAESPLHYRGLVVENKEKLNHSHFNENEHDVFYYKMIFSLLNKILSPDSKYDIYLDIKDTKSRFKLKKLCEVLSNDFYDFTGQMINHMQNAHSCEIELMQVADFITGAISYKHRRLDTNIAKISVINHIESKINKSLLHTTPLSEQKINLFIFQPRVI